MALSWTPTPPPLAPTGRLLVDEPWNTNKTLSRAVEHTPRGREVVGSNPTRCWAFPLLYLISRASLIRSNTTDFSLKNA